MPFTSETRLKGKDLRGKMLSGETLENADLSETNWEGVNLSEMNLRGVNLHHANLRSADLSSACCISPSVIAPHPATLRPPDPTSASSRPTQKAATFYPPRPSRGKASAPRRSFAPICVAKSTQEVLSCKQLRLRIS
jgi:hypothetical protein